MISSIIFTGITKDIFNKKYRYIETRNSDAFNPSEDVISIIPTLYWTRDEANPLNHLPNNSYVIIQGHLESDKHIGLYVLVETFNIINKGEIE